MDVDSARLCEDEPIFIFNLQKLYLIEDENIRCVYAY
jgi:hypothetical protein